MALIFEDLNNVAAPQDNVVKTGSMQSFKADVVDDSKNRVVLAYFLSPQNPACEQFGQLLEKYVRLADGKAVLVKFDVAQVQQLAIQLGIQSVPTTMIFAKGGLVDGFAGAIPETQLKTVMQALIGKAALSLDEMLKNGLTEEVKKLREMGCHRGMVSMQGLGYKEILDWMGGNYSYEEAVRVLKRDTRHFAKRQLTWFRREGEVTWVDKDNFDYDDSRILSYMLSVCREKGILPAK